MSFPYTGVLDDFNRDNEGPPPSSNWHILDSWDSFVVSGNQVVGVGSGSGGNALYWKAQSYNQSQEVYVTVLAFGAAVYSDHRLFLRISDPELSSVNGYLLLVDNAGNFTFYKMTSSSGFTSLHTFSRPAFTAGHKFGVRAVGSVFQFFTDEGSGWVKRSEHSDATYLTGGYVGLGYYSSTVSDFGAADDFGGGTYAPNFGTTPILDGFNRANEGPPPSSNWHAEDSWSGLKVDSAQLTTSAAGIAAAYWKAAAFAANQEAYLTINGLEATGYSAWEVQLRISNPESASITYYGFSIDTYQQCRIVRYDDSATFEELLSFYPSAFVAGGKIGLRITANLLEAYLDENGASGWLEVGEVIDSTYPSGGYIGVVVDDRDFLSGFYAEDFGGGAIAAENAGIPRHFMNYQRQRSI